MDALTFRHRRRFFTALLLFFLFDVAATPQEVRTSAFRATNYEVTASLDPARQSLAARVRADFEARATSREMEVELHPNLRVSAVTTADGKPVEFDQDLDPANRLRLTLPEITPAGQSVALNFEYTGRLAGAEMSPVQETVLARVSEGTSYLLQAARWFPLTDYPSNRYTATFHIEVPEGLSVVGTGKASPPEPVAPKVEAPAAPPAKGRRPAKARREPPPPEPTAPAGPRVVYTFQSEVPEAAGTFVTGMLQSVNVQSEGLEIPVHLIRGPGATTNTAMDYAQSLAKMVNVFSSEFGSLPRPNLSIAQLPEGTVPGYSAPGLLLVNQRQWDPKVNYKLLARLAALQWWAYNVIPASAADAWLSDGLARYSEGLYVESLAGTEGFNRSLEDFAVGALMYEDAAPIAQAQRLEPFSSEYRSVVVNKGAMVFHMLRNTLGDEPFRALLREYHTKFAGKTATLADFEQLAKEKARSLNTDPTKRAINLTPFFAQWLNSTGVPEFKLEYVVYRTQQGFRIVGKVEQDLETFQLPVEMKIETEGNPEYKIIDVVGTSSDFSVETFGRPKPGGITLDPNNHLLKSSSKLRLRAIIARGENLAEDGRFYDAIQQYQRAIDIQKDNSLAHFRMGEAFFYQKNLQAAANAFREAQVGVFDPSYKWVIVWSHIYLGKIFDITGQRERAVNEYQKAIETNDDTGGAQAEAQQLINEPYSEEARKSSP